MLKKTLFLIAPLATLGAVAAIATAPTSAAGDQVCVPGTPSYPTPVCFTACSVPSVVGQKLGAAKSLLTQHNCSVGKIKLTGKKHKKGFRRTFRSVVRQSLKAGVNYPDGTAVNLTIRWHFKKT